MEEMSKVYVRIDDCGRIVAIEGGYATPEDLNGWIEIDEGYGDRYNLCQHHYLPSPLVDDRMLYRWKLVDGVPVERTQEEIDADWVAPEETPSEQERLEALEANQELIAELLMMLLA